MVILEIPFTPIGLNVRTVGRANTPRKTSLGIFDHIHVCLVDTNRCDNKLIVKKNAAKFDEFMEEATMDIPRYSSEFLDAIEGPPKTEVPKRPKEQ
jgi:hypothetical protein